MTTTEWTKTGMSLVVGKKIYFFETENKNLTKNFLDKIIRKLNTCPTEDLRREIRYYIQKNETLELRHFKVETEEIKKLANRDLDNDYYALFGLGHYGAYNLDEVEIFEI